MTYSFIPASEQQELDWTKLHWCLKDDCCNHCGAFDGIPDITEKDRVMHLLADCKDFQKKYNRISF